LSSLDEFDPMFLTELVGHIYEAALEPRHWSELLVELERIYPDSRVTLFGHENGRPCEPLTVHRNFAADDLRAYVDYYVSNSPYVAAARTAPVGRALYSEAMVGDRELRSTEHYNDFVKPRRLGHYATGVLIERLPNGMTALSLADHKDDADRRGRQFRLLELLAPHLKRAVRLHRTVASQKLAADAAQAAFDRWTHAAFVLNSVGRVVVMNRAAEKLIQCADGLWLGREGALRSIDEARTRDLDTAVRKCAAMSVAIDPDRRAEDLDGIVLPRPSGAAPLRAMISPLPFLGGPAMSEFAAGTVLLVVFDADNVSRTPTDWLARQFGLTPAEQRLTEAIINGVPLNEAAEQLGIRVSTARTRLKVIQAKTHCRRQVDLVRLALSLPLIR
jgi:DNA-binding CsgD family transcriptional regulator/PAS domain-containing protein